MRAALVVLALAVVAGLLWFLRGSSSPDEVWVPSPASTSTNLTPAASPSAAAIETQPTVAHRDALPATTDDPKQTAPVARSLRVRVRNAAGGHAANVPVRADLGAVTPGRVESRPTGRDGIATFPLAQRAGTAPDDASFTASIPVTLELAGFEPVRADVPAELITRGDVFDLTLPPCGTIAVRLVSLDGQPARHDPMQLELRPLAPAETLADVDRRAGVRTTAENGTAEFAFVPLHSAFALIPHARGLRASFARQRVLGPTTDGQRVEVTLREDATAACVVVRLVDPARAPLREVSISVGLQESIQVGESSGMTSTTATETTDDDGELRLWFDAGGTKDRVRRITFARAHPESTGRLTIDHPLPVGISHLGDVVLDFARTVALAGRVLDEQNAPVAAARIEVSRISRFPGGGQARTGVDVQVRSDDDGAFEIRFASPTDAEFAVSAHKDGYLADGAAEARFGTADLRLRLLRAGSITGSLAIDAADQELVGIRGNHAETRRTREPEVDRATGAFAFESLAAGSYTVEVTLRGVGQPIVRVPDVIVRAGEATADPRLQGMTLPAGLRRVLVLVQDSAGRPLADAVVRADEPADVSDRIRLRQHGSDGVKMLAPAGTAFVASAPGFRSQNFTLTDDTHTVRLLPGIPLRVRIIGDYASAHPDLRLAVSAAPTGATQISYFLSGQNRSTSGSTHSLDALFVGDAEIPPRADSATLLLPSAGRWTIGLQAIAATGGMRIAMQIRGDSTQEITVSETGGDVTLRLTASEVSAAVAK